MSTLVTVGKNLILDGLVVILTCIFSLFYPEETAAKPQGNSMVIVWSLVGVGCATLAILTCCLVAFCRVRRKKYGRKNAYRHHIDTSSITSSVGKDKHLEQRSEPVSVVKIHH